MTVSQAQILATKKYRAKTYDTIGFDVPKGKRDAYKRIAAEMGMSLAAFLTKAADSYAVNYAAAGEKIPPSVPTSENKLSADDRRLIDSAGKLTPDARRALVKFLEILTARSAT